jgi:hypothetical protein
MALPTFEYRPIASDPFRLEGDRLQEEAARGLLRTGARGRTTAAETAIGRLEGLEEQEKMRASQAAGQILAQATGGGVGGAASGAVLAAGEEAGRQAATQYSEIAGRAARDIFAAETALGEAQMQEAEIMKGTTLSAERANKKLAYSQTIAGYLADADSGVYSEEEALTFIAGLAASESDPEVREFILQSVRGRIEPKPDFSPWGQKVSLGEQAIIEAYK